MCYKVLTVKTLVLRAWVRIKCETSRKLLFCSTIGSQDVISKFMPKGERENFPNFFLSVYLHVIFLFLLYTIITLDELGVAALFCMYDTAAARYKINAIYFRSTVYFAFIFYLLREGADFKLTLQTV